MLIDLSNFTTVLTTNSWKHPA